ncbi:hypothetical protein BDF21DRAFT_396534 [Thamnidium elegans]|uniref:Alcohol dehydrogenase n=1 Tax=Thamnidium elegans TaxID=101142 RepID=A0A8H7VVK6_9FUNG|nr:hypothetical protein INT48_009847 [Thamnidium elegans]KAI8088369.1 hypothetical protein BDF21DRAFT_396534 [Thamnidium elegans]
MTLQSSSTDITSFEGKVAVVTGGSSGIGNAICDELIKRGAKIVIGDISDQGREVVIGYNREAGKKVAVFLRTDVSRYDDNKALFQLAESEFGGVDIAILNAGTCDNADNIFTPLDDKLEERIFNVNVIGMIKGSKVAILHMAKRGGGSIVCTSSAAGFYSVPALTAYVATKHAIIGYVKSCTFLPEVCNVRINAVCPTFVDTTFMDDVKMVDGVPEPFYDFVDTVPTVPIPVIIDGVFKYLGDNTKNGETVMAYPSGLELRKAPEWHDSLLTDDSLKAQDIYLQKAIPHTQQKLSKALERYERECKAS